MPVRSRARRTRAGRARRSHFTNHAAARRRRNRRHHRRTTTRSRGRVTGVTRSINMTGVSPQQRRTNCMVMSLIIGVIFVVIGLIITFQVSSSFGIAPISIGILAIAAAFIMCLMNFQKPENRTVQLAPTLAPTTIATAPPVTSVVNTYTDEAPSYATTVTENPGVPAQYSTSTFSTATNPEPPPPSYAEATMKVA